jgi:hypothetical protein
MKRLALIFCLLAGTVHAATYYVRKDGTDGAGVAGTATNTAWLTVSYAESRMGAGDTVYVGPGTYAEAPTVNISGNSGAWIRRSGPTATHSTVRFGSDQMQPE